MKVAIIGYGKMGKTIHGLLNNEEVVTFDNEKDFANKKLSDCDVAIEFSMPEVVVGNIMQCFEAGVPVVVGTTAWYNNFEQIQKACEKYNGAMVYATNFSIGVNIFFELNKAAAKMFDKYKEYTCSITEIHHTQKLDAPSGTGITLAEGIIENTTDLENWSLDGTAKDSLPITALREEDVKGTHIIKYASTVDDIELTHTAHSREGFAKGSIYAAKWLVGKKGMYNFKEVLDIKV